MRRVVSQVLEKSWRSTKPSRSVSTLDVRRIEEYRIVRLLAKWSRTRYIARANRKNEEYVVERLHSVGYDGL